jgi:hypothetical protein
MSVTDEDRTGATALNAKQEHGQCREGGEDAIDNQSHKF